MMTPAVLGLALAISGVGTMFDYTKDEEWSNGQATFGFFMLVGGLGLIVFEANWYFHFIK
jgi:hypothetical protein